MLASHLFNRVAGADRIAGNAVRLLRDGAANYPAWLAAVAAARHHIHFENYIIRDDSIGRQVADALIERAAAGVTVRVLYDWLGCLTTPRAYWNRLRAAGIEVRCFNRPWFDSPFLWLSRNHRKTLTIDGTVGYVSGLCVADVWQGDPARGIEPWRDTGIELRGPALADLEAAFAQSWAQAGPPLPQVTVTPSATTTDMPGAIRA